jgi:signal transduction histidine kinase
VLHQKRLTERLEQAAARTLRSERQFGAAFESVPVGLLLLDGGGHISLVNRAAAHLFGYARSELLGRPIELLLPDAGGPEALHGSVEASGVDKLGRKLALDLGRTLVDTPEGCFVLATLVDRSDRQLVAQMRGAQAMSRRMVDAEEAQRKRMAREVHDALGQPLTALKLDLGWLAKRLTTAQPDLRQRAIEMETLVASTIEEVRRLGAELRPAVLDDQGLTAAVRWQAGEFEKRTGLRCTLALDDGLDWDADRCTVAYRVLQEALTNVARHARARQVDISLRRDARGHGVLDVTDDGCGIEEGGPARPGALGLLGMRERAALHNGTVHITSHAGAGTTVSLRLPVESDSAP